MPGKLLGATFRSPNVEELAAWYGKVLGFSIEKQDDNSFLCQFPGEGARLKLVKDFAPKAAKSDQDDSGKRKNVYWKIGLTLADVDLARTKITNNGTKVSSPSQFLDIGYLCHLTDLDGRSIELLQQTFAENFVKPTEQPNKPLGQDPLVGQITLRCSNIDQSLQFYRDILGMKVNGRQDAGPSNFFNHFILHFKLLSIQDVKPYNFTLYFLAFTEDSPPCDDLHSIEIREWLWKRSYTTLELQHCIAACPLERMDENPLGVQSVEIKVLDPNVVGKLTSAGFAVKEIKLEYCIVSDPDGAVIVLYH